MLVFSQLILESKHLSNVWFQIDATARLPYDADVVFAEFDHEPIAAASLAQVHRAVVITTAARGAGGGVADPGEPREVAVKVQRPGLARQFQVDLATMAFLTSAAVGRCRLTRPSG